MESEQYPIQEYIVDPGFLQRTNDLRTALLSTANRSGRFSNGIVDTVRFHAGETDREDPLIDKECVIDVSFSFLAKRTRGILLHDNGEIKPIKNEIDYLVEVKNIISQVELPGTVADQLFEKNEPIPHSVFKSLTSSFQFSTEYNGLNLIETVEYLDGGLEEIGTINSAPLHSAQMLTEEQYEAFRGTTEGYSNYRAGFAQFMFHLVHDSGPESERIKVDSYGDFCRSIKDYDTFNSMDLGSTEWTDLNTALAIVKHINKVLDDLTS